MANSLDNRQPESHGDTCYQDACIRQLLVAAGRQVGFQDLQAIRDHWPCATLFDLCVAMADKLDASCSVAADAPTTELQLGAF